MEKLLFINACMRGSNLSRTYRLCRVFLDEYVANHPGVELEEVNLTQEILPYFDNEAVIRRENLIDDGKTDHEMFRLARQFALADKIVIGAPYWDLSFPAALKVYVEHISVRDITFCFTPTGIGGLCLAKKLMYITTGGGLIMRADCGSEYFKNLCVMYGIEQFAAIRVEGLEIQGNDAEAIMLAAEKEAAASAKLF
jgi:FMN-dependent NADH-azoreductase